MAELVVSVDVDASAERSWSALVDWERQGDWMLLTRVRAHGDRLEAVTGVGPFSVRDPMVLTQWDPPHNSSPGRCVMRHTGELVRGAGAFEVEPLGSGPEGSTARSRVTWSEWFVPPLGLVGQLAWLTVRPLVRAGIWLSLRRFAAGVAGGPQG